MSLLVSDMGFLLDQDIVLRVGGGLRDRVYRGFRRIHPWFQMPRIFTIPEADHITASDSGRLNCVPRCAFLPV